MIEITKDHIAAACKALYPAALEVQIAEIANHAQQIAEAEAATRVHPDSVQADETYIAAEMTIPLIPRITTEQAIAAHVGPITLATINENIATANTKAEAEAAQSTDEDYITAEQARELGAGNAEWLFVHTKQWYVCDKYCFYAPSIKYRAIKQPKPVEPHAELKALYAQQVKDGTLDDFVWEYKNNVESPWVETQYGTVPGFYEERLYRCTPKPTCQVKLIGGEVQTMTREKAKLLQAETRDTHDWFTPAGIGCSDVFVFAEGGAYTYKPKAKKQISWADMPVGVMTNNGEFRGSYLAPDNTVRLCIEATPQRCGDMNWSRFHPKFVTLAPADQQPWLNWRGGACPVPEGIVVQITMRGRDTNSGNGRFFRWDHTGNPTDIIEYRVIGIESGYELGGVV